MTTQVTYAAKAGGQVGGAQAEPASGGTGGHSSNTKVGAVVVVQEWHGVNDQIKAKVDRFAGEGYLALAPDLYHGKITTSDEEAARLLGQLDWPVALGEVGDAVAHLRRHPRSNGKVAVLGFCMGGAIALSAARYVEGLACAVAFYGMPQVPRDELAKTRVPIQAHFAKRDDWAKASVAEELRDAVRAAGGHMDLFVYDAGHAFMRDGDAAKFDADASQTAWPRALDFLKQHLT
jgi:carboxymethylenebutenolidase